MVHRPGRERPLGRATEGLTDPLGRYAEGVNAKLTTTGRKTGTAHTVTLYAFADDDRLVIAPIGAGE